GVVLTSSATKALKSPRHPQTHARSVDNPVGAVEQVPPPVEEPGDSAHRRKYVSETACAPHERGHRTLSRTSFGERRDSSETRVHTAGQPVAAAGDETAGTGVEEPSIGSVTGTGRARGALATHTCKG